MDNVSVESTTNLESILAEVSEDQYPLPSHWKTFICSQENLLHVYQQLSQFPILFDDLYRGNFQDFINVMIDNHSIILTTGDYGLCRVSEIVPGRDAQVHLTFWDRRFRGRDDECKQAMMWLFNEMQLHRATIKIPEMAHYTVNFIKALGFKKEGHIRESWAYKGKLIDLLIFGILRSDVFPPEVEEVEVKQ